MLSRQTWSAYRSACTYDAHTPNYKGGLNVTDISDFCFTWRDISNPDSTNAIRICAMTNQIAGYRTVEKVINKLHSLYKCLVHVKTRFASLPHWHFKFSLDLGHWQSPSPEYFPASQAVQSVSAVPAQVIAYTSHPVIAITPSTVHHL
jgi:hypothetical protein